MKETSVLRTLTSICGCSAHTDLPDFEVLDDGEFRSTNGIESVTPLETLDGTLWMSLVVSTPVQRFVPECGSISLNGEVVTDRILFLIPMFGHHQLERNGRSLSFVPPRVLARTQFEATAHAL